MALVSDNRGPGPGAATAAPARDDAGGGSRLEAALFHLALMLFFVGAQVVQVPTRIFSADNSWHFRLARDVVSGDQIYWAAVDANRLFPDLLFSIAAFVMPGGERFSSWLYGYHIVFGLALYGSLVALAASLFETSHRRRLFLVVSVVALTAFLFGLKFWAFWLLVPGNHGGGLPVVFLCLALLFSMRAGRAPAAMLAGTAFVAMAALLVASNRLVMISLVAPLLGTLILAFALRGPRATALRRGPPAGPGSGRSGLLPSRTLAASTLTAATLTVRILATLAAGALGILLWGVLASLSWHKLVAQGGMPEIELTADWVARVLTKESAEFRLAMTTDVALDIALGVLVLVAALVVGGLVLGRALARRPLAGRDGDRVLLAVFAALSALAVMAFTVVKTDDTGSWHYRYIALSLGFAIVSLSALPVLVDRLAIPRRALTGLVVLALPVALAGIALAAGRRHVPANYSEAVIQQSIADLARLIGQASGGPKLRGYAEYWVANDISTRSDVLEVGILDSVTAKFRFYNNNASDLCSEEHFFILHAPEKNEPKRDSLRDILGEPIRVERTKLETHGALDVLYYDPARLKERITLPGRENAQGLFPGFTCARRD